MKRLTLSVLREFNTCYEFNLSEDQLKAIYKELTFTSGSVTGEDILDEFELMLNS
jgi:hypothetical protein